VILVAEIGAQNPLPSFLLISAIYSVGLIMVFALFLYIMHGVVEKLFHLPGLQRTVTMYGDDTQIHIRRTNRFIDFAVWGLVLVPALLLIWGVFESIGDAISGLLAYGFNLGSNRITIGMFLLSIGVIYASFLISGLVQRLVIDDVLGKRRVEKGIRHSIARLLHYVIMMFGFLIVISALGFEITKLTIIFSALGIGIGFGLQGVVNNFVSGLILLFERPVRVGDSVEISGKWGEIKKIGLRSTIVQTVDLAELIIPNADLIINQVTNWTFSSRQVRVSIRVGVAYGSDVPLVIATLTECAENNALVNKKPEPCVLLLKFSDSSLDFELRAWVSDADQRLTVTSELHQEINRRFREKGITIPFPQRDIHVGRIENQDIEPA
jgi:small-conductance mechanosensitive channel